MTLLPKIEKVTRDAALTHFLLMFGYKLFSLYFPLFLAAKSFSVSGVGNIYFLIYLPLAVFAPFIGFLNHKINPAILASAGISGYALYALGMIFIAPEGIAGRIIFYLLQIILGISASLFFVSFRVILMGMKLESPDRAFGWFYSASFYAAALAPAVGAFFVWKFGFAGVFLASLILQVFTAAFCFSRLRKPVSPLKDHVKLAESLNYYRIIFKKLGERGVFPPLLISFSILLVGGFYQAFFVLFLKDVLRFSQNSLLLYVSLVSLLFLPVSLYVISRLAKRKSEKSIFQGSVIFGFFSLILGAVSSFLNFWLVIFLSIGREFGGLTADSGRSGLISRKFEKNPEEAGAIDTIFAPMGTALGALIAGFSIKFLGYQFLFAAAGLLIIVSAILAQKFAKN